MKYRKIKFTALIGLFLLAACNLEKIDDSTLSGDKPVAAFDITNAGCPAPCQVVFTNKSVDATTFEWDFGDGSPKVTTPNPSHSYILPGDYFVTLKATSSGGTDSEIKTVNISTQVFNKLVGIADQDYGQSVQQTSDGGYILFGFGWNPANNSSDMRLVKIDQAGNHLWEQFYGGASWEAGYSVFQTSDNGFILTGNTSSEGAGNFDVFLIKTDNLGNLVWKKTFGGLQDEGGRSVKQTSDGGYIILGETTSEGAGEYDFYLVKTDNQGNLTWKKTFGGALFESGISVQAATDGGYILAGQTSSEGAGQEDILLVKTDQNGNLVWKKTFGGTSYENAGEVQNTPDGGYIIFGSTGSQGAGNSDFYLIKTDNAGTLSWEKTFGGILNDNGTSIRQTSDGGYILGGFSESKGAGLTDFYLIKTDPSGTMIWENTYGDTGSDFAWSVATASDGGYALLGYSDSFGATNVDYYIVKTDKDGNAQ